MILVHLYLGKMARHQSSKVWCGTTRRASPPEVLWLLIGFDHDPMATPMPWPKRVVIWNFEFEHETHGMFKTWGIEGPTSKRRDWLLDTHIPCSIRFFLFWIWDWWRSRTARIVRSEPSVELVAMIPSTASSRQFRGKDGMGSWHER